MSPSREFYFLWLAIFAALFPGCSEAQEAPVSLNFQKGAQVVNVASMLLRDFFGKDVVITPGAVNNGDQFSSIITKLPKSKLNSVIGELLASSGLQARESQGVVYIERVPKAGEGPLAGAAAPPPVAAAASAPVVGPLSGRLADMIAKVQEEDTEPPEVYRPQLRSADYLRALLASVGLASTSGFTAGNQAQPGQIVTDVVLLTGDEKRRDRARKLLAQVDTRPASISVRAALVEFTDTSERNLSIGAVLDLASSKITGSVGNVALGANGAQVKVGGLTVALNALHGDTRFRYRSEAELRFVDGKPGRLQIGSDTPTRGDTTLTQSGATVQGTVYRSSGIVLTMTPRILQGRIEADVVQEVSSFATTTTSNIDSPTLNKRLVQATVDSLGGEIVVIGGLDEETVSDGSKGPFSWMQLSKAKTASKTQLFLLLEFKRLTPA